MQHRPMQVMWPHRNYCVALLVSLQAWRSLRRQAVVAIVHTASLWGWADSSSAVRILSKMAAVIRSLILGDSTFDILNILTPAWPLLRIDNDAKSLGSGRPSEYLHVPYRQQVNGTCLWGQTFVCQIRSIEAVIWQGMVRWHWLLCKMHGNFWVLPHEFPCWCC